jgi:type I restriction-modification system DNA methylase subunit/restriction endonuclease S subunit
MLNREVKKRIDDIHDLLVGKLPLPSERLELITISLIYKFMDDMDERSTKIGGNRSYFKGGLLKYSWRKILAYKPKSQENAADLLVANFNKAIKAISEAPDIPEFFQSIFRNSSVTLKDGRILKAFMDEISSFEYSNSEELGNAYEYMLLTFGNQKDIGAFRTPRHIIDFIVEIVQPHKSDKILDPACGTSGFLISAWNYIRRSNTSSQNMDNPEHWGDTLSTEENTLLASQIQGYDNTPLMVRLSKVNMFLHKIKDPQVNEYDTISSERRWNEKFDCILANPPFMTPKGGVKPHNKFKIKARKSELLFCDYIMEHLKPGGKAGFIVPEGIITNSSNNHFIEFRKWAVNEMGLWAVVSLPTGVFQPYAGVKTSILFFDRTLARTGKSIMLLKIDNDGYSLNTARGEVIGSDLPSATKLLLAFKHKLISGQNDQLTKDSLNFSKTKFEYSIIPREDFAKLDPYRATSTAWDICYKSLHRLDKAYEEYNNADKSTPIKADRQLELLNKIIEQFTENTGYVTLSEGSFSKDKKAKFEFIALANPVNDTKLKAYFESNLKEQAIICGEQSPVSEIETSYKLPTLIFEALENKREYSLSLERQNGISPVFSEYDFVRLGDNELFNILSGGTPDTNESEYWNGQIPWATLVDLPASNFFTSISHTQRNITEKGLTNSAAKIIPVNSIIVSTRATIGRIAINLVEMATNQGFKNIVIKDFSRVDTHFVAYIMTALVDQMVQMASGAVFKEISKSNFSNLEIPLPSLKIQKQIITELNSYQRVIDGCNSIIENFVPVFDINPDWPFVKLNDICTKISDGTHFKPNYTVDGFKFLSAKNVVGKVIDWNDIKYVDEAQHLQLSKRVKPQRNDVLLAKNGTTGVAAIVDSDEEFDIYVSLALLRPNQMVIPKFLLYMINSGYVKQQFNSRLKGVGVPNLHLIEIKDIDIPLPSIEEQNEIIKELEPQFEFVVQAFLIKNKMELKIRQIVNSLWNKE